MSSQIRLHNIHKHYTQNGRTITALNALDLSFNPGDSIAITGESGSGKTTLLNILGFLDKPTSGSYVFFNQETTTLNEREQAHFRNQHIGFIFQSYYLLPHYTAIENVLLPLQYAAHPPQHAYELGMELLRKVGLESHAEHLPSQLSGGQQQRVSVARAIVNQPSVLLADEPTAALDSKNRHLILELLLEYQATSNCALILITHDTEAAMLCQQQRPLVDGILQ